MWDILGLFVNYFNFKSELQNKTKYPEENASQSTYLKECEA